MNVQIAEPSMTEQLSQIEPVPAPTASVPSHLRRLVLTGFMGAGKTTVGSMLADRLGWNFLDLDTYIESRAGLPVPSIFAERGECHFRKLESQALVSALGMHHVVLALGGGTPEILTNRLLLEQTPATATIFLDAPFSVLFDRCTVQALDPNSTGRPNLADPAAAESRFLARQPLYRRLAHHTIDTESLSTGQTVATLLARLNHGSPRGR